MNEVKNPDVNYNIFLNYLNEGREIEFFYNGVEYFISNEGTGRTVWVGKKRISDYFNDNPKGLLNSIEIEGFLLENLIKQKKITISTIF